MPPSLTTARDIPLLITSTASSSERRITPSWTIAQLKAKLEPVTGIPPSSQKLILRLPDQHQDIQIQAEDEESVQIGRWTLVPYAEIKVTSATPTSSSLLPPLSSVEKQTMPLEQYEKLHGTVREFKAQQHIGRFDPSAPERQKQKVEEMWREVREKNIVKGSRCRIDSTRRGTIAFVGPIASLPGPTDAPWIGVALDEPTGKNDGSFHGERYFQCEKNKGVVVRAEKVEVGDFAELGLEDEGSDMEEM